VPQNKRLNPPSGSNDLGIGSGVVIGDGVMLTAGHVMYDKFRGHNTNYPPSRRSSPAVARPAPTS
jgi:V8-like Glu-specific endopeptidase